MSTTLLESSSIKLFAQTNFAGSTQKDVVEENLPLCSNTIAIFPFEHHLYTLQHTVLLLAYARCLPPHLIISLEHSNGGTYNPKLCVTVPHLTISLEHSNGGTYNPKLCATVPYLTIRHRHSDGGTWNSRLCATTPRLTIRLGHSNGGTMQALSTVHTGGHPG